ncbi:efflux RND transporter permease subunit [Staphylospora marina]|uniref:efflux RND transporter permease subunit n=1 Tax=Staphylospora marina TaxID=2490858 RepID=UPI0013DE5559|nr:efflux RND transporter permease subunit [Staphylospora marina]
MNWLTRFSLRNVAAILILVILVTGGGVYTASQLKMEAMPDISFPVVVAITPYPGASPEDIDDKVTQPIEKAIQGIKGMKKVTSISADSTSVIVAEMEFDTDLDKAQQEMEDAINRLNLPEGAMDPMFNRFGFNTLPVVSMAVTSSKMGPSELERWAEDVARPALESVNGVGEVQIKGEGDKAVYIRLKPDKLKKYNLSAQQVQQALMSANLSLPVGDLTVDRVDMPVRIEQKIRNVDDLKNYEITVPVNPAEGFEDAFKEIGKGFQGLGEAVGGLGQAVGGLGQAVSGMGQAMGGLGQAVGGLGQALQQAQLIQAQLVGELLALNEVTAKLQQNPDDPALQAEAAKLKGSIAAKQQVLKVMADELRKMQSKLPKGSAGNSMKMPSAPAPKSGAAKAPAPKVKEVEIQTVKLSELASITESAGEGTLVTRTDGKTSVNIDIVKDPDANLVEVADKVREKVAALEKDHASLVNILTLFDSSKSVKASVHSMVREGALGALFASVIILLFLRNFRTTLISIVSIPVSVMATLAILGQTDITLNVMTLGGLAVAIGRVVDDSIVVIENIYRHLMKNPKRDSELIRMATKEVASAITSSTLTTVAVFVPLAFVDGIVGKVFTPFALTVAVSLLCSLVVAVTIVPVLARLMLLRKTPMRAEHNESRMGQRYRKALAWALDRKGLVLTASVLLLVGSLGLIPLVGTSFLPAEKDKAVRISLKMPSGTELSKTDEVTKKIEDIVRKHKEVEVISSSVGNLRGQLMNDGSIGSSNRATIFVGLSPSTDMERILEDFRRELAPIGKEGEVAVNEVTSVGPPTSGISVIIKGEKREDVKRVTEELTEKVKTVEGLTNVSNNLSAQKDKVTITVDDAKAARHGLVAQQVAFTVRGLLEADKILEIDHGNRTQEVKLGLAEDDLNLNTVEALKKVDILTATGKMVKLGDIATVKQEKGPVTIQKENARPYANVTAAITVKDTGAVSAKVRKVIDAMDIPEGIEVTMGGDTEEMNKSFEQLGVAMVVAVAAVYIVMIIAFGEATAPFTIMFSLPFALIGGLVGLLIAGQPISVSSMIGFLMLIGIVVTNAIVLIDRVQQMRARGMTVREALIEAAGTRLRPILMTALATIFALLPLGLGYGEGTLISQGLAVVVIGGLASSTLLTLFIVPIMYAIMVRIQEKVTGKANIPNHV